MLSFSRYFLMVSLALVVACQSANLAPRPEPPPRETVPERVSVDSTFVATEAAAPNAQADAADSTTGVSSSVRDVAVEAVVPINDRHYPTALMHLIDSARTSIHVCLYQVRFYDEYPGSLSNQLLDKLILASRRGVEVEVLIDTSPWKDNGVFDRQNQAAATRLVRGGCRVWLDSPSVQSHQKIAVFDGRVTVVSSANWSHYSLSSNREVAAAIWGRELAATYLAYFRECREAGSPFAPPSGVEEEPALALEADAEPYAALIEPEDLAEREGGLPVARDARVTTLNDRDYYWRVREAIEAAEHSVTVVQNYALWYATTPRQGATLAPEATPRLAPSQTNLLLDDLVAAHQRGLDVKAVFDMTEYEDGRVEFGSEDFAHRLHALGVETYYDDPTVRIHSKMLLIDDEWTVIGSTNWSFHALELNHECSVLIDSKTVGREYRDWIDSILARARPAVMPIEKNPPIEILPPPERLEDSGTE